MRITLGPKDEVIIEMTLLHEYRVPRVPRFTLIQPFFVWSPGENSYFTRHREYHSERKPSQTIIVERRLKDGQELRRTIKFQSNWNIWAVNRKNKIFALDKKDDTTGIFDPALFPEFTTELFNNFIMSLFWHSDNILGIIHDHNYVELWDLRTGKVICDVGLPGIFHNRVNIFPSPNSKTWALVYDDLKDFRFFDFKGKRMLFKFRNSHQPIPKMQVSTKEGGWSSNGKFFALRVNDRDIYLLNFYQNYKWEKIHLPKGADSSISWHPSLPILFCTSDSGDNFFLYPCNDEVFKTRIHLTPIKSHIHWGWNGKVVALIGQTGKIKIFKIRIENREGWNL